jgi:hypothetical protein
VHLCNQAEAVGSGSTGRVYLGVVQPGGRPVALKATTAAARGWHRELRAVRPLLRKPHRNVLVASPGGWVGDGLGLVVAGFSVIFGEILV